MPDHRESSSNRRAAPFPMRRPANERRAVKKPPFIKPILFGPPTRAARKLRQAQLAFAHSRHGKKTSALNVPAPSSPRASTSSHRAAVAAGPIHLSSPPLARASPTVAVASAGPAVAVAPAEHDAEERSVRPRRQDTLDAISSIARSEAEVEEAQSPSKWCTKEQKALVQEFFVDYRTAGNATRRRELAHRFYDVWFLTFPPLHHLVEEGRLPLSVLRPTHVLTKAEKLMVADEQMTIRQVCLPPSIFENKTLTAHLAPENPEDLQTRIREVAVPRLV